MNTGRGKANDHLIFSKGHASPLLYSMFKAAGTITDEELMTEYRRFGSRLEGPNVVAFDGEVSNSTHAEEFAKVYPERYFEMLIAERQLVAAVEAAGIPADRIVEVARQVVAA